jgi:hypothetical protein
MSWPNKENATRLPWELPRCPRTYLNTYNSIPPRLGLPLARHVPWACGVGIDPSDAHKLTLASAGYCLHCFQQVKRSIFIAPPPNCHSGCSPKLILSLPHLVSESLATFGLLSVRLDTTLLHGYTMFLFTRRTGQWPDPKNWIVASVGTGSQSRNIWEFIHPPK